MYINFALLKSKELLHMDMIMLQLCKQQKFECLKDEIVVANEGNSIIKHLTSLEYITSIKGKVSDSKYSKLRLTKKGIKLLEDLETPEVTEDDLRLFDWLCDVYASEDKVIGNKRKTKMYIAQFRVNSGIERNELANLLQVFLGDSDNMTYNLKLENAFFKPAGIYQTKFELDQSRLWIYYQKNKELIDSAYKNS